MTSPENDPLLWKVVGATAGTIISLAYIRPLNLKDATSRFAVSFISGTVFGFVVLRYFNLEETAEHWVAGSAVVALFAWFGIGLGIRIIKNTNKLPKK